VLLSVCSSVPSLKADEDFIEYLALGAEATERVIEFLESHGHRIIELERGALSSKIWKNKEKALRVPDLLCLNCGRRIESRGKRNLEITMSHSTSDEERAWDYDARDNDWVALVKCFKTGDRPRDWEAADIVNIVSYRRLRATENKTKQERSGPSQGSELTITWKSTTPSADGRVKQITDTNRLQVSRESDGYTLSYSLERKIDDDEHVTLEPLVEPGEFVHGESQLIAAPFQPLQGNDLDCNSDYSESDFVEDLDSDSFADRFAGIKALGRVENRAGVEGLKEVLSRDENIFVKIEAASSLALMDVEQGWEYLTEIITEPDDDNVSERLEVTIILGEIPDDRSVSLLKDILRNDNEDPEVRAEAAHSLGKLGSHSAIESLIDAFRVENQLVRRDALRGLSMIIRGDESAVIEGLNSSEDAKLGTALALAKSGTESVAKLLETTDEVPDQGLIITLSFLTEEEIQHLSEKHSIPQNITDTAILMSDFFSSWADEFRV